MKVLILPLLAAVVAAEPQFYAYNNLHLAASPLVKPVVYAKPVHYETLKTMEYEKVNKKPVEEEKVMKVETYAHPTVYGQQIVYKTPVLTEKVNVPARFHIKNGKLEHTSFTKREAEADPIFPYYNTLPVSAYSAAISPVAPAVVPYTAHAQVASPLVYNTPLTYHTPAVIKKEVEYLKPKVAEEAKTVANDAITPFMYSRKGTYKAENAGAVHIAKREAEPFNYFGAVPYTAYHNVMPFAAATYANVLPYATPLAVKTFSNDRVKAEKYAAKDQYHAENAGAIHIAKREAEAEPLTVLPYTASTYYQRPVVYSGASVYSTPYVHNAYVNTFPNAFPAVSVY